MAKIKMRISVTLADTFQDFLANKKARGISEKTLATYGQHFSAIRKHISQDIPIDALRKADLDSMISSMRDAEPFPVHRTVKRLPKRNETQDNS